MAVIFQNSTSYKSNGGMSDHDIVQANNELKRRKDRMRYTITLSVCVVWMLYRILTSSYYSYAYFLINMAIGLILGYIPAEFFVRRTYGSSTGVGVTVTAPKIYKYTFTDDKIIVSCDFDSATVPYFEIERVTQNPYSFFVYHRGNRYQMDKTGFSTDPREFEKLMLNNGKTIGVEYEQY